MTVNIIVENMKNAFDYYKKGLNHGKLEKYQEAIENFNKAIELDPNCKIAIENLKKLKNF